MTVFQNKILIKAFLEKKNQGRRNGGKLQAKKVRALKPIPKLDLGFGFGRTLPTRDRKLS